MDVAVIYKYILEYFKKYTFVPTVRDLSDYYSCSTSTIQKCLKELENKGDIIRKKNGSSYRLRNEVMIDLITSIKECTQCKQCKELGQCVYYEDGELC